MLDGIEEEDELDFRGEKWVAGESSALEAKRTRCSRSVIAAPSGSIEGERGSISRVQGKEKELVAALEGVDRNERRLRGWLHFLAFISLRLVIAMDKNQLKTLEDFVDMFLAKQKGVTKAII